MKTYKEILFAIKFIVNALMLIARLLKEAHPWLQ